MKQQDTTYKLTDSEENGSIWHESYDIEMVCPKCRIESKATFKVTQKSVRIDCMNEECKYIMFYRQVVLGYVETPKVE